LDLIVSDYFVLIVLRMMDFFQLLAQNERNIEKKQDSKVKYLLTGKRFFAL